MAFVVANQNLQLIDVSDTSHPYLIDTFNTPGEPIYVSVCN